MPFVSVCILPDWGALDSCMGARGVGNTPSSQSASDLALNYSDWQWQALDYSTPLWD